MSLLIIGDLHLHERREFSTTDETGLNSRLLEGRNVLHIIAVLVKDMRVTDVVFTGDIFELKDRLPGHVLLTFYEGVKEIIESGAKIHVCLGNHDFKLPKYPTIKVIEGIKLYDQPITVTMGNGFCVSFVPFLRDKTEFKQVWIDMHKPPIHDILIFHNEIPGAYYSTKIEKTKIPGSWEEMPVESNRLYFGGHLHHKQTVILSNNRLIHFIGTPYPIDFDDIGEEKSIIHLGRNEKGNIIKSEIRFYCPQFIEIGINLEGSTTLLRNIKGNYVRIKGETLPENKEKVSALKERLLYLGAKGVKVAVKYKTQPTDKTITTDRLQTPQLLRSWVDQSHTNLNKDHLVEVGLGMMGIGGKK